MLRCHFELIHFMSSRGGGLHDVTGQGDASAHTAGVRVSHIHVREGAVEYATSA